MFFLKDPVRLHVLITGGASGIGKAIARKLVAEGAHVTLAARNAGRLAEAAQELAALGKGKVATTTCDVRDAVAVKSAVAEARKAFGPIDVLINNSGLGVTSRIVDCTDEEWDLVLDTNLKGTFLMTRAVLPDLIERRTSHVINIASQAAKHGYAGAGPYCASKYGVLGFGEALQKEVQEFGILVHSLCPALVQVPPPATKMDEDPNVLQADDVAATVLFLLQQPRRVKFENIGLYNARWSPDA